MPRRGGHPYFAGAPLLIAHRGGSALAPENTLRAFDRALRWWGADILELDVQPTRDGEAVVFHDPTLERTTNGHGRVRDLSFAQLRELDAGFRFSPDGGRSFPFRGRGETVASLEQVLAAFPRVRINVEIKHADAALRVRDTIAAAGATGRVLVAAGERANRLVLEDYPGPLSAAENEIRNFWLAGHVGLSRWVVPAVDALQIPDTHRGMRVASPRLVRAAHRHNIPVHVWTVDEVADMERLLAWNVDGIISDRPDRLAEVLHRVRGRPLPPGPAPDEAEPFLQSVLDS